MCAIAGLLDFERGAPDQELLRQMASSMRYRGPDAIGLWRSACIGLSHARLAIVDLEHGAQPMQTPDGRVTVSFNGEIFNHRKLRSELEGYGHRFLSRHSDTEVILQAYLRWGADCFTHFNGQWAIALWDARCERLLLSRDRFGICPLHYTKTNTGWLFASEIKALFCHPDAQRRLSAQALSEILTLWTPLPGTTAFESVYELEPGSCLTIDRNGARSWRYWHIDYCPEAGRSADSWAEELRELLEDAVRLRLQADVPVGLYLSGGLDSSAVAACAGHLLCDEDRRDDLSLFSIRFAESEYDERRFQRDVAQRISGRTLDFECDGRSIADNFCRVIRHTEKPLFRTAPAPLFLLSRMVRDRDHCVVLTGEGADEILGGYDLFKEAKIRYYWSKEPSSTRRPMLLRRLYPYLSHVQLQSPAFLQAYFPISQEQLQSPFFSHLPRWMNNSRTIQFLSPDFRHSLDRKDILANLAEKLPQRFAQWDYFQRAQYLETSLILPGYILSSQGDRVTMANGVEARPVYLDHRLAELANRMPSHVKMAALNEKSVLKKAADDLLPTSILKRPKQPYRAPEASSFFAANGKLFEPFAELVAPDRLRQDGVFQVEAVTKLVQKAASSPLKSFTENMALVSIFSTQALIHELIREPSA